MKILLYILCIPLVFSLISCDELFVSPEEKLEGTWYFDKVTYTKPFSFNTRNVTSDFEGIDIEFEFNGDVTWLDTNTGDEYSGDWNIRTYEDYNSSTDNYETIRILEMRLVDFVNQEFYYYDWELSSFTRKKIIGRERVGNRNYKYRLKKY